MATPSRLTCGAAVDYGQLRQGYYPGLYVPGSGARRGHYAFRGSLDGVSLNMQRGSHMKAHTRHLTLAMLLALVLLAIATVVARVLG